MDHPAGLRGRRPAAGRGSGPREDGDAGDDAPGGDEAPAAEQQPQGGQQPAGPQPGAQEGQPATTTKPQEPTTTAVKPKRERKAAAKDKGEPRAQEAAGAEAGKPADPKPAEQPKVDAPAAVPKSPEQYRDHALAWISASTSLSGLEDKWRGERDLRVSCMVVEDIFDEIKKAKDKKATELKAA